MARTARLSTIGVALLAISAEAREGRWNKVRDAPPRETMAQMEMHDMAIGWSPRPTTAPKPRREIFGLEDRAITSNSPDTCGYVSGVETQSIYCGSAFVCVADAFDKKIGCCPYTNTNCNIWTTCLNSNQGSRYTTDNGLTQWCGSSDYPNCLTHVYYDDVFSGYTLFGCGRTGGSDSVFYLPTAEAAVSSSSRGATATSTSSALFPTSTDSTSSGDTSSDGSSDNDGGAGSSSSSTTSSKKKSNTGGIVGGVVGGVAALAIIGFAILFFLKRRGKKNTGANNNGAAGFVGAGPGPEKPNNSPPPMMAAGNIPPGSIYQPQSPMQQQPQYQQQQQQQPGMMANNGMAMNGGYAPSGPGSLPPPGSHMPSMYGTPSEHTQQQQQYGAAYPSGVSSQYGNQPVSPGPGSGGYPTPSPGYTPAQPLLQQPAGGYNNAWAQSPAGTPPQQVGQQQPPPPQHQQQGFATELPADKGHGEVRELA